MADEYASQDVTKLAAAMVKVQSALKPVDKDKENPFFHSKYADLVSVWESCRSLLADNGISVIQATVPRGEKQYLRTLLLHTSGQWLAGEYLLNPAKPDPQGLASAVTYARRYALTAMLGIVCEAEDDDGNVASTPKQAQAPATKPQATAKAETKAPVGQNENGNDVFEIETVPTGFNTKVFGDKTSYSIKVDGGYMNTFDDTVGSQLERAAADGSTVKISYIIKGKYKNIVSVEEQVAF